MGSFSRSYRMFWRTLKLFLFLFAVFNFYVLWKKTTSGKGEHVKVLSSFGDLKSMGAMIADLQKTCPECLANPTRMAQELQKRQALQLQGGKLGDLASLDQAQRQLRKVMNGGVEPRLAETQTTRAMDAYFAAHVDVEKIKKEEQEKAAQAKEVTPPTEEEGLGSVSGMMKTLKNMQQSMKERNKALKEIEQEL